ncbi:MAG: UPF0175 family protein [bacterium]
MGMSVAQVEMPDEVLAILGTTKQQFSQKLKELAALKLFQEGKISSGKASELVEISRMEFIEVLAKNNIPFFRQTPDELAEDIAVAKEMMQK